jgi:transposase
MSKKLWVGLDVGADTMSVCVVNDLGVPTCEEVLPTSVSSIDALLRPMRRSNIIAIGLEAGATSIHLARGLTRMRYPVAVFECRQVSAYLAMRGNKTDKNDARCIAEVTRTGRGVVSEVTIKSTECQRIRSMLTLREQFIRMRVAGEAGIGSLFRLHGGKLKRSFTASALRREVQSEVARLKKHEKIDLREDVEPMLALCERMRAQVELMDRKILKMAKDIDPCRRFMEIPGVGPLTALSFYSAIGEPYRFERNADVGAYLGLVPRVRQSGVSIARLRISKMGSTMTRRHLSVAASVHLRANSPDTHLKTWGTELRERRGRGRARAAVARKLAVIMLATWKRGEDYDPHFAPPHRSP